jgi:hypothetical protein
MKKSRLLILIIPVILVMINCNSTKKSAMEAKPELKKGEKIVSYAKDVAPILRNSCTPCHFPPTGKKKPYETYEHVKGDIASIIERVKLPHDDPGFMPFKMKKMPLNDSLVGVLVKWQKQNMPE